MRVDMLCCGVVLVVFFTLGREGRKEGSSLLRLGIKEFYDSHDMHIPVKSDKFVSIVVGLN